MSKLNWNRPIHRQIDERKKDFVEIRKKPLGDMPVQPIKMTFGKYKGFSLKAIPSSYLEWLISISTDDKQAMRYARELASRPEYLRRHKLE